MFLLYRFCHLIWETKSQWETSLLPLFYTTHLQIKFRLHLILRIQTYSCRDNFHSWWWSTPNPLWTKAKSNFIIRHVSFYAISFCAISFQGDLKICITFRNYAITFGLKLIWHRGYAIIFGLTRFAHTRSMIARLLLKASRKRRHCDAFSDMYGLTTLVI